MSVEYVTVVVLAGVAEIVRLHVRWARQDRARAEEAQAATLRPAAVARR